MKTSAVPRLLLGAVMLAGVHLAAAGCGGRDTAEWVTLVKGFHAVADQSLDYEQLDAARLALLEIVRAPKPAGVAAEDFRVVMQDATFRIAQIELSRDWPESAIEYAERGLALGRKRDLFEANLLAVRGRSLERLGRDQAAAEDFQWALQINEELLRKAMAESSGKANP